MPQGVQVQILFRAPTRLNARMGRFLMFLNTGELCNKTFVTKKLFFGVSVCYNRKQDG